MADLLFTMLAQDIGGFEESNPIAAPLIGACGSLIAFKLISLIVASVIFIKFRRHVFTEISCWLMSAVHVWLALVWFSYYFELE